MLEASPRSHRSGGLDKEGQRLFTFCFLVCGIDLRGGRGSLSGSLCRTSKVQVALASKVGFFHKLCARQNSEKMIECDILFGHQLVSSECHFQHSLGVVCCCLCFLFLCHRFTGMHISVYD